MLTHSTPIPHSLFGNTMFLSFLFKLGAVALSFFISLSSWSSFILRWCSSSSTDNMMYDFIIVGAGSAGSTMAGRLSENGFKILLLEAGGPPPTWSTFGTINIPIFGPLWQRTDLDWAYTTEPQVNSCGAFEKRKSLWPRGRVLGGSGRLNNMVYLRGHIKDWEKWGFSFSSQLHYFKKSEKQLGQYIYDSDNHNTNGWLPVSDMPFYTELSTAVLKAAQELNYFIGDLNTMLYSGFMKLQTTTHNGARFSADSAFLYSSKPSNLHIKTDSLVSEVILDDNKSAKGVKFYSINRWHTARSRHGVILSAGAIESPKILLQTGIGPVSDLLKVKIPIQVPSPLVGKNLQDHVSTGSDLVLLNTSLSLNLPNLAHPKSFLDYIFKGQGPLTHGGCEATGLLHTKYSDPIQDPPDIQLLILPVGQSFDSGSVLRHNMGLKDQVWKKYFSINSQQITGITILVVLLHPFSKGQITLKSRDPFEPPVIDPRYLSDHKDVETLVEGIYMLKRLLKTEAMSKFGAYLNPMQMPGCEEHDFDSRDYWRCYIRMLTYTVYHPAGTCRMGREDEAVVDYSFRVYGAKNLYVVDASVLPTLPSANINAAVIALAERASDVLLGILQNQKKIRKSLQQSYFSIMTQLQKTGLCSEFFNTSRGYNK